ncbi:MAG: hypothetical protein ACJ74Z_12860 [Bryobacteraceae bacterium]
MFRYLSYRVTCFAGFSIAFLVFIPQAFGTTYYVSSSTGSNSFSGTDTAHPWQTVSKVSSPGLAYAAGDSILFRCGDVWKQGVGTNFTATLATPNGGTSAQQITYGHYSTSGSCGILPVLDANGVLAYVISISKNFITLDGLQLQNSSSGLVEFGGSDGIQLLNLTAKNGGIRGFVARDPTTGSVTIDNLTYSVDAGKHSDSNIVEIWSDAVGKISVTNSSFDRCSAAGTPAGLAVIVPGGVNTVIQGNVVHCGAQGLGIKPYQNSAGTKCTTGDPSSGPGLIADNYIDGISVAGGDGELIEMEGCPPLNGPLYQHDITIARNILICKTDVVGVGSSDAIGGYYTNRADIFGNVLIGGCQSGSTTSSPGMMRLNASSINMHVHNNTLVGAMPAGDTRGQIGIGFFPGGSGTAENNIIKNVNSGIYVAGAQSGTSNFPAASVVEDYNIFDTDVTTPYSLGGGTITHATAHSRTNTHPGFVASTSIATESDVKLRVGALAIGAGFKLGSPYNLILDPTAPGVPYNIYDQGTGVWMAGAFGPPAAVVTPVGLSIVGAKVTGATIIPR